MDIDELKRQKLAEIEERARQKAVGEILALKGKYRGQQDLTYVFEHNGQTTEGVFLSAGLGPECANAYQIIVLVLPNVVVNGQCYITDMKGERIGASGRTQRGEKENRVFLDTLAM
jgi:hypothetical protein